MRIYQKYIYHESSDALPRSHLLENNLISKLIYCYRNITLFGFKKLATENKNGSF